MKAAQAAQDATALERALKWHLCLHDVLLRGPRRGTRGAGRSTGLLEARFEAWRAGDRQRLQEWWRADGQRGYNRACTRRTEHAEQDEEDRRIQAADEALSLIRDGEMARAMRLLHSNGVAGLTTRILGQLWPKNRVSVITTA